MSRRVGLMVAGLGTALAGAATAVLVSGVGLAATSPRSAASGTEHFSLMTTQPSASKYVVIASGLFTAGGVDIAGSTADLVKLTGGTFKVHHGGAVKIIKEQINPQSCLAMFEATSPVTFGNGTGAYKGISGKGTALITDYAILAKNSHGACNPNANPRFNQQTIKATAKIKL